MLKVIGTIVSLRRFGKMIYGDLNEENNIVKQYCIDGRTNKEKFNNFLTIKLNDSIEIEGELILTSDNIKTVIIHSFKLL